MNQLDYDKLEETYKKATQTQFELEYYVTAVEVYREWIRIYAGEKEKEEEKDEFDEWVTQTREEAKQPRNRHLRRFLELGPCRKRPTKLTKPRYARFHK